MKKIFTVLFISLLYLHVHAQYSYVNLNSQSVNKSIANVVSDNSGNVIISGDFENTITFGNYTLTNNVPSPGSRNAAFVAKKLTDGNYAYAKAIKPVAVTGATSNAKIYGLTIDYSGNAYVTGSFSGRITFDNTTLTSIKFGQEYTIDMFTAKISSNGSWDWAKSSGTNLGRGSCGGENV